MTPDEYDALRDTHICAHALIDFAHDPELYQFNWCPRRKKEETSAMALGTAVHSAILTPDEFQKSYFSGPGPINPKTGKSFGRDTQKFEEWLSENSGGKVFLTESEWESVSGMARAFSLRFSDGSPWKSVEEPLIKKDDATGLDLMGRPDAVDYSGGLVELKTTQNLDTFRWDIDKRGYNLQVGFYAYLLGPSCTEAHIVAIESHAPYRIGVWCFNEAVLTSLNASVQELLFELKTCKETGFYPSAYLQPREYTME